MSTQGSKHGKSAAPGLHHRQILFCRKSIWYSPLIPSLCVDWCHPCFLPSSICLYTVLSSFLLAPIFGSMIDHHSVYPSGMSQASHICSTQVPQFSIQTLKICLPSLAFLFCEGSTADWTQHLCMELYPRSLSFWSRALLSCQTKAQILDLPASVLKAEISSVLHHTWWWCAFFVVLIMLFFNGIFSYPLLPLQFPGFLLTEDRLYLLYWYILTDKLVTESFSV